MSDKKQKKKPVTLWLHAIYVFCKLLKGGCPPSPLQGSAFMKRVNKEKKKKF